MMDWTPPPPLACPLTPIHAPTPPIVDDFDELNMYCRHYHHAENPNAATEPIDDTELQGYVKRTLLLVGCLL